MPKQNLVKLSFGRYEGRTLTWVALHDPEWLFWSIEENIWRNHSPSLRKQAMLIFHLSQNIAIPGNDDGNLKVQYIIDGSTGKFQTFEVVDANGQDLYYSYPNHIIKDVIDLSFPRRLSKYDKTGGRLILSGLKYYYFGDESYRLTENRCYEFFSDATHFDWNHLQKN